MVRFLEFGGHCGSLKVRILRTQSKNQIGHKKLKALDVFWLLWLTMVPSGIVDECMDSKCPAVVFRLIPSLYFSLKAKKALVIAKLICNIKVSFKFSQ